MDETGESEKAKRVRISWKNLNVVKTFLEACIQEISVNGREGGSLKQKSWTKVSETLKDTHNFVVDRKQMKNHYDYLKGKYGAWLLLRNKTGNVYDLSTNTFNLTDEEWEIAMKGAIGALDGTLVHAIVPTSEQTAYRGRGGGRCYQNVLGVCDFNMIFTFVWAGWEGIAHDSRILTEVVYNPSAGFPFPQPNKYYLCDAAYANTRGFLAPYRNTRYWLADFKRRRALTKEEKFNHAHAQLRNVIERSYGVLKARFPILEQMASYKFSTQRNVVIACFAIHNFIRKYNIQDELFLESDEDTSINNAEQPVESAEEDIGGTQWGTQSTQYMTNVRDEIANQIVANASI